MLFVRSQDLCCSRCCVDLICRCPAATCLSQVIACEQQLRAAIAEEAVSDMYSIKSPRESQSGTVKFQDIEVSHNMVRGHCDSSVHTDGQP